MMDWLIEYWMRVLYVVTTPELIPVWVVYAVGYPLALRRLLNTVD